MAMRSNQIPRLHLTINEAAGEKGVEKTWHPSNALHGLLEISCITNFEILETSIFLEGVSRNWISQVSKNGEILKISKVESKFLSQALDISPHIVGSVTAMPWSSHLAIPFDFIISRTIAGSSTGSPSHCLQLPPSIELGKVYIEDSGKRFAQPSISYHVRAFVNFTLEGQNQPQSAEAYIPILIMPHTEELPPTDVKDFPAEFKLQESRTIRGSLLGRSLGTMTISMLEPRALTYHMASRSASTEGLLNIEIEPISTVDIYASLQAMSFKVLSLVRLKTFYSVKPFPRLPSQTLLTTDGVVRMRDDMIKLETRKIPSILWGYTYRTTEQAMIDEATRANEQILRPVSKPYLEAPQGKWTARISHPICVDSRLLPTFCSSIVARLYSIILRVKVSGIKKESFDFEVPLQVVHTPPNAESSEAPLYSLATNGPMGEDTSLLEVHRPSATSWFSNESLESEELPPRYYS